MIEPASTHDRTDGPSEVSTLFRWGSQVVAAAGWGKSLFTQPHISLLVAGVVYSAALWLATGKVTSRTRAASHAIAVASLLACIASSQGEALVSFAPLIPIIALAWGLRAAFIVMTAVTLWSCAIALYIGEQPTGLSQIFIAMFGSGVFLVEFSRLLLRERETADAIARQAQRIAELSAVVERHRVAQQMHDGIGHYLSAAIVQLEIARMNRQAAPERVAAGVDRARELVADGMAEVRRAVAALREHAPSSFEAAVSELIQASEEAGIPVDLFRHGAERRLSAEAAWALYATLQEALTNIRKHARAARVRVDLRYLDEAVELTVVDDGVGVATIEPSNGLRGIEARAAVLGGFARFNSTPDGGFEVTLRLAT
ncbi:MAG: sensor histidine kinase [Deltaproteobacteria bacterium]|nr:sensor histidine kinase [Deltaproteobacteria bacterium]MBK8715078.1 sensor histidine kinase [Deltaproteobacteria bacterium]MBP7287094.1 sensor histidine kinase [Nannocystaceae bacterium]